MQRQTLGIVALAEDNREDAAAESDVRFLYRYRRAGMFAFFCSDAFEYPSDSDRLQRVFLFGRKSIPLNKNAFCPAGLCRRRIKTPP